MPEVPLFDSLTHPMPDGSWLSPGCAMPNTAAGLRGEMEGSGVRALLAVGMGPGMGGYREDSYAAFVQEELPEALPVAFFDLPEGTTDVSVEGRMERIAGLGYRAVKIHPRLAGIDYSHPLLPSVLAAAGRRSLPVLLCTYPYGRGRRLAGHTLDDLLQLIETSPETRLVLMHGGVLHVLEVAEAIRPYPHVLLDLSFTLCRFAGSSLDLDLRYLFHNFDRRLCVGSDHPEYSLADLRRRFDEFATGLPGDKTRNIAHRNLQRCLDLSPW